MTDYYINPRGYEIVERPSDGLILVQSRDYGQQLWVLSKMTTKNKDKPCPICGLPVGDNAFRPFGNPSNRSQRICTRHGEAAS